MTPGIEIVLVVGLTVSIFFSGLIPLLLKSSEVAARPGDFFKTVTNPHGSLKCEINKETRPTELEIVAHDSGSTVNGLVTFEGPESTATKWSANFLNINPGAASSIFIGATSSSLSGDEFLESCILSFLERFGPIGVPELRVNGFITGNCFNTAATDPIFDIAARATGRGGFFVPLLSGNFEGGQVQCFSITPNNSPPGCKVGNGNTDNLVGTSGNDCIDGRSGDDKIIGGAGNDKINGGEGKDLLIGGDGNDELTGGPGADTFSCGSGTDKITDFNPSEVDKKSSDCEQF
ncbi:MAG TPA: calcium-binding protein [Nitrososphaeraceae archaeon]|jgi:Ca2+-binding RTX toxin-like protein